MNNKKISAICLPLLTLILYISVTAQSSGVNRSMMDTTCQPCEDFYKYANGGWLKNNTIPTTDTAWSRSSEIAERTRLTLREILEESAKKSNAAKGSGEQLIGAYYAACTDEAKIEANGAKALEPHLARIEKIKSAPDVQTEITNFHRQGLPALFGFGGGPDNKFPRGRAARY